MLKSSLAARRELRVQRRERDVITKSQADRAFPRLAPGLRKSFLYLGDSQRDLTCNISMCLCMKIKLTADS